jgi:small-conductance mechanosensitive channel
MNPEEIIVLRRFKQALKYCLIPLSVNFIFMSGLSGQKTDDVDSEISSDTKNEAPVKLDGKTLFFVHGISSYPAELRASTISKRIKKAAEDTSSGSDSVRIIEVEEKSMIYAGTEFIMSIYDIDAKYDNIDRESLTHLIHDKINTAIAQFRYERSRPVLIGKSIHALGAAILLSAICFLALWLLRLLDRKLQVKIRSGIDSVEIKSFRLIKSGNIFKIIRIIFRTIRILTILIITVIFIEYILGLFPWTNNVAVYALELFIKPLKTIGNGILGFLPGLAFLIVIFLITRYVLKLIKLFFTGINQGAIDLKNFHPTWAMPSYRIAKTFIIAFAVVVAYPYIPGSQSNAFKGVTVFIGVLFSLGSSSFIGNIIAGYSMIYRLAFQKGDLIEVDGQMGFVEKQEVLVTRLLSFKNETIVIPNSILQNSKIINYSAQEKDRRLILHTMVGIGYETPWRQVDAMLKLAADRTAGLLTDPPPFVLKKSLGDFAVNYEINVYCDDSVNILKHYTSLHQNILDVFNENNVQIMTPAYVLDPATPKVVPSDQWDIPLVNKSTGN